MELDLGGKIALVSGSSRGIGKEIAKTLAIEGCRVYLNGRTESTLQASVDEIRESTSNPHVRGICCDLTETAAIRDALSGIMKETGRWPGLIVASIGTGRSVSGWDIDDVEWERMFSLNFFGAVRLTREAVRIFKDSGGGSIVCIASIAGCDAVAAPVPYSTAKTALISFVKNTADTAARHGVRINAVSPGNVFFEGGTWDLKMKENRDAVMEYIGKAVPMNGFATPNDVADITAYLLSERARFITGANFIVDGGQVRKCI